MNNCSSVYYTVWDSENSNVARYDTIEGVHKHIKDYIDSVGFKSYYWRYNMFPDFVMVDYGSHSHFFYYKEHNNNDNWSEQCNKCSIENEGCVGSCCGGDN